ncbi:hypothetical protein [Frankia sp. R82]|uniref:hypothetical protein n=1 Tax=Frankia sp. R82 TaxID=2950553 RepID=UPI002044415C|nr:hypothetical protein [Frankia sp. R82]MCM3884533.1 hypothetical protein [Frankia sp. R82]
MVGVGHNLLMPEDRVGHPYRSAGPARVSGREVQLTYHHAVPYSRIRDFWDKAAGADTLRRSSFFLKLRRGLGKGFYVGLGKTENSRFKEADRNQTGELSRKLYSRDVFHTSDRSAAYSRPEGWDNFVTVYTWLPGNLFVGPTRRSDDPGDSFEKAARPIFERYGATHFKELLDLDEKIREYLATETGGSAGPAFEILASVARYPVIVPFDEKDWGWGADGRAYIKRNR